MRISKQDRSYVEIYKTNNGDVAIIIGSRSSDNPLERIISTIEISEKDFVSVISEIFKKES